MTIARAYELRDELRLPAPSSRTAPDEGCTAGLTDEERNALALLVRHTGEVVRSEELYTAVWGDLDLACADEIRRIWARQRLWRLMSHLRRKMERVPDQRGLIQTVQGAGYRIE